jgi:hypothetical protein
MAYSAETPGFVVTTTEGSLFHKGITQNTLESIIKALAIESPWINRGLHGSVTSIYIYTFPNSTPAPTPPSESKE